MINNKLSIFIKLSISNFRVEKKERLSYVDRQTKWRHDMYDEREQTPKSTNELINSYGYDIKKSKEPPKEGPIPRYKLKSIKLNIQC